jgi:hypothetical protein
MHRHSTFSVMLFFLLLSSSPSIAQQSRQWSVAGAFGSSTQLSLSYLFNPQWQVSFILGPIGDLARTSTDGIGFSAIYYLNTSDSPIFIGVSPRVGKAAILAFPIGIQHKITDDFGIRLATELFRTRNELHRTAGGVGISLGGFINL